MNEQNNFETPNEAEKLWDKEDANFFAPYFGGLLGPRKPAAIKYCVGFMLSDDLSRVALIRKIKPAWQAGLLNGIGGHVEPTDASAEFAMMREFCEETCYTTHPGEWQRFAWMGNQAALGDRGHGTWEIDFWTMRGDVNALKTVTAETVEVYDVETISVVEPAMVDNLPFLISLARLKLATGRPSFSAIQYPD